jgi:hypothetical protein
MMILVLSVRTMLLNDRGIGEWCEVWGSHHGGYEDYHRLRSDGMYSEKEREEKIVRSAETSVNICQTTRQHVLEVSRSDVIRGTILASAGRDWGKACKNSVRTVPLRFWTLGLLNTKHEIYILDCMGWPVYVGSVMLSSETSVHILTVCMRPVKYTRR